MENASYLQGQSTGSVLNPNPKNHEIEKLRAIAIIFVMLWHNNDILLGVWGITPRYYGTWTGVDLFFCISGYVITKSLLASLAADSSRDYLVGFYTKRIFRIWPSVLCCIGAALLIAYLCIKHAGPNLFDDASKDALPALLNYANFSFFFNPKNHGRAFLGVFWSLSLEEQFYLIIPFLLWWFRRRLPVFMVLLLALAFFQFVQQREPWKVLWWSLRTDALIYGVIIAVIEYRYNPFFQNAGRRIASYRPVITLLLLPALFALLAVVCAHIFLPHIPLQVSWAGVISACLVFIAALNRGLVLNSALSSPALIWIGSRSYALYLFHNIVFITIKVINFHQLHIAFDRSNISYYFLVLTAIGCLCGLCELCYRFVEVPLRNIGRGIAARHFSRTKIPA
jgi:peptidoglycan/LPS O-acetylase OafA/YrhL